MLGTMYLPFDRPLLILIYHLLVLRFAREVMRAVTIPYDARTAMMMARSRRSQMQQNPLQLRLAEITEMIHAASLFHDDVIDEADTRRGVPSVNKVFGNKLAILAGKFVSSLAGAIEITRNQKKRNMRQLGETTLYVRKATLNEPPAQWETKNENCTPPRRCTSMERWSR